MGVDPVEVLQWIGTRDDLIARFVKDNPGFDEERATQEVDKFMMDAEMVNKFIAFEKKKASPDYLRQDAMENMNDPGTWGIYAIWIAAGVGFTVAKNLYIEPKYRSGEWEEIHINLDSVFKFGGDKVVEQGAAVAGDAVASVAEVTSQVIDAVQ